MPDDTANLDSSATGPMTQAPRMGAVVGRPYQEQSTLSAGEVIQQRFKILRFLARGGAGEVYEAYDLELRCPVALKIVRPEVAQDELAIERFRREIALARQVTHPNVSRIFDVFRHTLDGASGPEPTLFLTMELLVGETLSQLIQKNGPLTPDQALPIIVDMVEGLKAAHRVGIIHRDFKSANVMLARQGDEVRAVITDFGLARGEGPESSEVTNTGIVVGTPYYMAPEQLTGDEITAAADVYSLGIVIYEMLTGQRPFTGSNEISTAIKRLTQAPASPRVLRSDLPPNWERAILGCLEVDVGRRLTDLDELVAVLTGTEGRKPEPRPDAGSASLSRAPLVRRGIWGVAALLAVLGALLFLSLRQWSLSLSQAPTLAAHQIDVGSTARVALPMPETIDVAPGYEWLGTAIAEFLQARLANGRDIDVSVPSADQLTSSERLSYWIRDGATLVSTSYSFDPDTDLVSGTLRVQDDRRETSLQFSTVLANLPAELGRLSDQLEEALGLAGSARPSEVSMASRLREAALEQARTLDYRAARWLFEQAGADDARSTAYQALVLWRLGDAEDATRNLRRAREQAERSDDRATRLVVRAIGAELESRPAAAERAWSALFEFFPDNRYFGGEAVHAQLELAHYDDARESLAQLARLVEDEALVDLLAARLAADGGSDLAYLEAARTAVRSARSEARSGLLANAHFELAKALDRNGQVAEALAEATRAIEGFERLGDFQAAQQARTFSRFLSPVEPIPAPVSEGE